MKSSTTGGVKPMSIAGRYVNERERLIGMTDEERAWRAQWLKDQILSPNEPRHVPEMYKELYNPIRRVYRAPLDSLAKLVEPYIGATKALYCRYFTGKILLGIAGCYVAMYYFKYCGNDWTRLKGWRVLQSRSATVEGDPGYPKPSDRTKPEHYASRGFDKVDLKF